MNAINDCVYSCRMINFDIHHKFKKYFSFSFYFVTNKKVLKSMNMDSP